MRTVIPGIRLAPSRRSRGEAPRRARRGFSIVEAIVAIVMLAFGVLALASSSAMTVREMSAASNRVKDAALAASRFERLRSVNTCATMSSLATSMPGMTVTQVIVPGQNSMVRARFTLPATPGIRRKAVEFTSNIPCT